MKCVFYSDFELYSLRLEVKNRLSQKRFDHTLGVATAARRLGEVFLPACVSELVAAALLHDIAKEIGKEESLELILTSSVPVTDEDLDISSIHHSIAGVALIKRDFQRFATENVLNSVYNHTVGSPQMDLFSEIIFLSDYIEDGRSYYYSKEVAKFLYNAINSEQEYGKKLIALHTATVMVLEHTINSLTQASRKVHSKAILTKNHFSSLI